MENQENRTPEQAGEAVIQSSFIKKLDNFWYHYKIHTIAALFIVFVIVICSVQTCSRADYDIQVLYAGGKHIPLSDDSSSLYTNINSAFKLVCDDYDKDGIKNPLLLRLTIPTTNEELENLGGSQNEKIFRENTQELETIMVYSSEYYLCFLSEPIFIDYDQKITEQGIFPLEDIRKYAPEGSSFEYASDRGIYLRSTDFYKLPGIKDLPENTVICLRVRSEVMSSASSKANFNNAEDALKSILAYTYQE